MTNPNIDLAEALYLMTHEHPQEVKLGNEHLTCERKTMRRLFAPEDEVRYLPAKTGLPFFTADWQLIQLTHEHEEFSTDDAIHKNCRQVICREPYKHATIRYLPGAQDLQVFSSAGTLEPI